MTRDRVTQVSRATGATPARAGTSDGQGSGLGSVQAQLEDQDQDRAHHQRRDDAPRRRDRPIKRSLTIAGHRTSVSLEAAFWDALKDVAAHEQRTTTELVAEIDARRGASGLSGAIRIYILEHFRARARPVLTEDNEC